MNRHTHLGVYGLIECEGEFLLIRKARGPYRGKWDLPGGRPEFGESPELALVREIEEETGLTDLEVAICGARSNVVHWLYQGQPEELYHVGILYDVRLKFATDATKIRKESDGHDSLGAGWFTRDQVQEVALTPFAEHMIRNHVQTSSQNE